MTQKFIIGLGLVVFFITAITNHGFYHADEHYQIIEFTGVLEGTHAEKDLAWEYKEQIRPTTQVYIAYGILEISRFFGIENPYILAAILRVFTGVLCFAVLLYFYNVFRSRFNSKGIQLVFLISLLFLWFIPITSIRYSSETWSGIFFLLGLTVYHDPSFKFNKALCTGLVLGFSVVFRLQSLVLVGPFLLWVLWIEKVKARFFITLISSIVISVVFNTLLDSFFYGGFVFTPWEYFRMNYLEDRASSFGVAPWHYYLSWIYYRSFIPIGIMIYFGLFILLVKKPRSIIAWCFILFVAAHSYITHKELRFLFPIVFLVPFIITYGIDSLYQWIKNSKIAVYIGVVVLSLLLVVNLFGIVVMASKSAGQGRASISYYLSRKSSPEHPITMLHTAFSNPYNPWGGTPIKFYVNENVKTIDIDALCHLNDSILNAHSGQYLVIRKVELGLACHENIQHPRLEYVFESVPVWVQDIAPLLEVKIDPILILYKIK